MQRSEEWFKSRRGKITASNLGALLGLVSFCKRQTAYDRIMGTDSATSKSIACEWGIQNEDNGIMHYMSTTANSVSTTGLHVHPHINWLAGSPDGLVGSEGMIEVKCPYWPKRNTSSRVHKTIPVYYYVQMNALLEIMDRQWCDYICWCPEGAVIYRVYRDNETFQYLQQFYAQIYAAVLNLCPSPPPISTFERNDILARIETGMERFVDYHYWSNAPTSNPPTCEDISEDEERPAKRQKLSDNNEENGTSAQE